MTAGCASRPLALPCSPICAIALAIAVAGADGLDAARVRLTRTPGDSQDPSVAVTGCRVHAAWRDNSDIFWRVDYSRSHDGGQTWSAPRRLGWAASGSAVSTEVAVAGDRVQLVWTQFFDDRWRIMHRRSNNGGRSWGGRRFLSPRDRHGWGPSVVAAGREAWVLWTEIDDAPPGERGQQRLVLRRSPDGGRTWEPGARRWPSSTSPVNGRMALDSGRLHVVWNHCVPDATERICGLLHVSSSDRGSSWTQPRWAERGPASDPVVLVARGQSLHLLSLVVAYKQATLWYSGSDDGGLTWRPRQRLSRTGAGLEASGGDLAVLGDRVDVVWIEGLPYSAPLLHRRSLDGGRTWGERRTIIRERAGEHALAADPGEGQLCPPALHLAFVRSAPGNSETFFKRKVLD